MNFQDYSPQSISDIVFASEQSEQLIDQLVTGVMPFPKGRGGITGILLYGPPGTGKSALAKLLPDEMERHRSGYPADFDTKYVQVSAGANGVAMLGPLENWLLPMPLQASQKYIILDEVDNLKPDAMNLLKSVMNSLNTAFILTTNNFHKIEIGVKSRCHCISFFPAAPEKWLAFAHRILADAGLDGVADQVLLPVIARGNGSARAIEHAVKKLAIQYCQSIENTSKMIQVQCTEIATHLS